MKEVLSAGLVAFLHAVSIFAQQGGTSLRLVATIPLPNVEGRIDHFGVDLQGRRLFMSALGNNTVEVFDLKTNQRLRTIPGLHEPQGVLFDRASKKIFVANGDDGTSVVFDGASYEPLHTIHFSSDADNVRLDAAAGTIYVGYGEGALGMIEASSGKQVGEIPLPAHPESFQLEKSGPRIFVNVPNASQLIVLDRAKRSEVVRWRLGEYAANFPMALDEARHRLFVVTRRPAELLVFDTESGKLVAHLAAVGDSRRSNEFTLREEKALSAPSNKRTPTITGRSPKSPLRRAPARRSSRRNWVGSISPCRTAARSNASSGFMKSRSEKPRY